MKWIMVLLLLNGQIVTDPVAYTEEQCIKLQQLLQEEFEKGKLVLFGNIPIVAGKCELMIDV